MKKTKITERENKSIEFLEGCLKEVLEERKGVLITYFKQRLAEVVSGQASENKHTSNGAAWESIDSLSKLRALVGGRFENLKNKWLNAGFPLKQAKNNKTTDLIINEKGWIELSSWISNQGYEVRRNPEKKEAVFEIKRAVS